MANLQAWHDDDGAYIELLSDDGVTFTMTLDGAEEVAAKLLSLAREVREHLARDNEHGCPGGPIPLSPRRSSTR